jgi:hypothetical protein
MSPDKHQILIDHLDQALTDGRNPETLSPLPGEPEVAREWGLLNVALKAIRYDGLVNEVGEVAKRFKEEETPTQETPVQDAPSPIVNLPRIPRARRLLLGSMKVAAGVLLLVCLGGVAKYVLTTPYGIYEKYYTPYELGTARGDNNSSDIENAYRVKNWPGVEQAYAAQTTKTTEDYFLQGMAFMEQSRYFEAMGMFRSVQKANDTARTPYFQDEAGYYLGMCYLAAGQIGPAREIITRIAHDKDNLFYNQVHRMNTLDFLILKTK